MTDQVVAKTPAPEGKTDKVEAKPNGKTETKKEQAKKEKEAEREKVVTTKQLAAKLGVQPATLRRYLRTLPQYQDKQYTRYGWPVGDKFLLTIEQSYAKHQASEKEKQEKAKAEKETKSKAAEAAA